jgi:hypothetical protein
MNFPRNELHKRNAKSDASKDWYSEADNLTGSDPDQQKY